MVLDAAKGIETQTRKLFEVCRLRDVPIITFVNKLDREGASRSSCSTRSSRRCSSTSTPASWPIGQGPAFLGCYDLRHDRLLLMDGAAAARARGGRVVDGLDDPLLDERLPDEAVARLREEVGWRAASARRSTSSDYRAGNLTPVFFGSALNNFGVRELLAAIAELAPPPRPQPTAERPVRATEESVTGFVFKIQANMDPQHRDRIAFVRVCSGSSAAA
jgi:peptide chain release factor 3